MMENKNIIISLYLVMFIGLTLFIAKMYFYTIHGDDPWFAEEAYWLVHDGVVRSEFFSRVLNYGVQQFAYHKLHIWIAAFAIKLFGLSFMVLKFITLMFFCILLWISRRYFYTYFDTEAKQYFRVFLAFILINSLAQELFFVYRPEMAITCFGFISYFFLRKSLEDKARYAGIAGIFSGLCVLLHLNGLIFVAAGIILLLANKRLKFAAWFAIGASLVSGLYFIDILPNHWSEYWFQFRHDPAIPNSQFSLSLLFYRMLFEYERFFGHGYESGYSLLLLVVLIANYKTIWQQFELRNSLIYFLALTVVAAAISPGKNHYGLLFSMPYVGILVSATLWQAFTARGHGGKRRTLIGFGLLYVLANVPHALALINDGRGDIITPQKNAAVMTRFGIHSGDKVFAPLEFIFNAVEKVHILGVDAYFMRTSRGMVKLSKDIFFSEASTSGSKFILLTTLQMQSLKLMPVIGRSIYGYTYLGSMHDYHVFRRAMTSNRYPVISK